MKYHLSISKNSDQDWFSVQNKLADIPGEKGIKLRSEAYRPFFLRLGKDVRIEEGCRFYYPERTVLDDDVRINIGALIYGSGGVRIGRHCRIGPRCFIHSANHDIEYDEKAYFEKGYAYDSVIIGDNCLISANVSILPGASLGIGSFVACGAVVPKGEYDDNSKLFGVPAKPACGENKDQNHHIAPSIALVAPESGRYEEAAKLLLIVLGLPQIGVFINGDILPKSVHSVISFGPPGWQADYRFANWHFAKPSQIITGKVSLIFPEIDDSLRNKVNIVQPRKHLSVTSPDDSKSETENTALISLYYCLKRIRKEPIISSENRIDRLFLAYAIVRQLSNDVLQSDIIQEIIGPQINENNNYINTKIDFLGTIQNLITDEIRKNYNKNGFTYNDLSNFNQKSFIRNPLKWCSVIFSLKDSLEFGTIHSVISDLIISSGKSLLLCYVGFIAYLINDNAVFEKVCQKLYSEYFDPNSKCMRNMPKSASYCYSAILVAVLIIYAKLKNPGFNIAIEKNAPENMEWHIFSYANSKWRARNAEIEGSLVELESKSISVSMLVNFLKILTVPEIDKGFQFELAKNNYHLQLYTLKSWWLSFFIYLQHTSKLPLILIKPWPFGYKSAISIRYDVDRNVSTGRLLKIADIQKSKINYDCGSWYLIPGNDYNERVRKFLKMFLQETALHARNVADMEICEGVTFHSGPGAIYWKGLETVQSLENSGSAYGEMLASQLISPKPVWIEDGQLSHRSSIWFIPIHFPLEGTTSDSSLAYFDRLIDEFRGILQIGGHAIIASHPDLNQDILVELLHREKLSDVWFSPIKVVVDRSRKLYECGALSITQTPDGNLCLLSKYTLSDVHISLYKPGESRPSELCLQLNADMPRVIL